MVRLGLVQRPKSRHVAPAAVCSAALARRSHPLTKPQALWALGWTLLEEW